MIRALSAVSALAVAAALAVTGCGGGGAGGAYSGNENSAASPATEGEATLTAAEVPGLGAVLVNSEGLTVYEFAKDKGTTSSCYGAYEERWPPVTATDMPTAGEGTAAAQLGTTKRKDGSMQVTYAGHPLYTFVADKSPREANGNGSDAFGGLWWALDEAGSAVEDTAATEAAAENDSSENPRGGYSGY